MARRRFSRGSRRKSYGRKSARRSFYPTRANRRYRSSRVSRRSGVRRANRVEIVVRQEQPGMMRPTLHQYATDPNGQVVRMAAPKAPPTLRSRNKSRL